MRISIQNEPIGYNGWSSLKRKVSLCVYRSWNSSITSAAALSTSLDARTKRAHTHAHAEEKKNMHSPRKYTKSKYFTSTKVYSCTKRRFPLRDFFSPVKKLFVLNIAADASPRHSTVEIAALWKYLCCAISPKWFGRQRFVWPPHGDK